ncbi:30S ribosomal protein S7 [Candidatus Woesebacteria bacterium]|jgi:small subunit ribosomal protein S7|nr:30S ribosomal protein S7 [Candidatus Woesebacteria bacterium]
MRTKTAPTRVTRPDGKYQSVRIAKLINCVMRDGKKSVAQKQVYLALEDLAKKTGKKPLESFEDVIKAVSPQMEVRSRRVGGASYQVPMPVRPNRAFALSLRALVESANKRPSKQYHTFAEKFVAEMLDALQGVGGAINKKNTAHRMADANKAFAHFRW